jgi:hypothetical protein
VREVLGHRAHFVERCPQFFIVLRIVANKKADAAIELKLPR